MFVFYGAEHTVAMRAVQSSHQSLLVTFNLAMHRKNTIGKVIAAHAIEVMMSWSLRDSIGYPAQSLFVSAETAGNGEQCQIDNAITIGDYTNWFGH